MDITTPSNKKISDVKDLKLFPAFSFYNRSKNLKNHIKSIKEILLEALPNPLPFNDKLSLEQWIYSQVPWISWNDIEIPPDCFSMFFIMKPIASIPSETFISEMIKRWLLPHEETTILSFEHMQVLFDLYPNQILFIGKAEVLIKNKKQADLMHQNLNLLKKEITAAMLSGRYARSLLESKLLPLDNKMSFIRDSLIKLIKKFPEDLDDMLFLKLASMQSLTKIEFREQRSYTLLIRIVVSKVLIQNYLNREINSFPEKRHMKILYMPTKLSFTFGIKPVLGFCIGINFFHKYEFFDEKHILRAVEKFISDVRIVAGSFYRFTSPETPIVIFYVEIEKTDGSSLLLEERKTLKENLEEELKKRIQHLVPSLFQVRNEEETMRNILILSRELKSEDDIPQMMVNFDQHSQEDLIFTIVLLRIKKKDSIPLQDFLKDVDQRIQFISDRIQIVSYFTNRTQGLTKEYPIEANVFRLQITKLPIFLRMDFSVNLYLARQEVVSFLMKHMGEVRDYNGGMMLKQGELLSQFKRIFQDVPIQNQELLENFFYSLNPIEAQATISLQSISLFFDLFLKVAQFNFSDKKSYIIDFEKNKDCIIAVIRANDPQFSSLVEEELNKTHIYDRTLISSLLRFEGNHFLSYMYDQSDSRKQEVFEEVIIKTLEKWQKDKDKLQVLKLPCYGVVSLDPRIGGDQESSLLVKLLFDGLMRIGNDGKPQCSLAESYTVSKNLKRYTFKIRESYWSDGSRVIAYDFEYAWKKMLSPGFSTPFAYVFYPIKNAKEAKMGEISLNEFGVKAIDKKTLIVDLENPTPYFIELTANTLYSPVNHIVDKRHPNWATQKNHEFVCNGPFFLKTQRNSFAYQLEKNDKYWNAKNIKIDKILFSEVKGKPALEMFKNKQLDCLGLSLITVNDIDNEEIKRTASSSFYPLLKISWQCFNVNQFPFNNHKVRLAFSHAINRKEIIKVFPHSENRSPAYTALPRSLTQHVNASFLLKEDKKKAQYYFIQALEELGIKIENFPIVYISTTIQDRKVADFLKSQWETTLGVKCEIESAEWKDHWKKMTSKNYQIGVMNWTSWIDDPIYTLQSFKYADEKVNFSSWENSQFIELLDLSDQTVDPVQRMKYLAKAEELHLKDAFIIPICYDMGWYIKHQKLVLNPHASNGNVDFSQAYFNN